MGESLSIPNLQQLFDDTCVVRVHRHRQLASTNDYALRLARREQGHFPLLVVADHQTAGRGRGQNRWWSGQGCLTFSVVLPASEMGLPIARWPQVSLAAGLAVCDALMEIDTLAGKLSQGGVTEGITIGLKWPNDVHLCGRKVCGILVETVSNRTDRLVVGIGINVNNSLATAPDEIRDIATSLVDEAAARTPLAHVLTRILAGLNTRCQQLAGDMLDFTEATQELCILTGHKITITTNDRSQTGNCQGIDPTGALLLETPEGLHRIHAGTVRVVD